MEIFCPQEYSGALMELAQGRRGEYKDMKFLTENRVSIKYELPLARTRTLTLTRYELPLEAFP